MRALGVFVLLVVAAVVVWWAIGRETAAPVEATAGGGAHSGRVVIGGEVAGTASRSRAVPGASETGEQGARQATELSAGAAGPARAFEAIGAVRVHGVCVRAEDGLGLAGCTVESVVGPATTCVSDANGAFSFEVPFDGRAKVWLRVEGEGRIGRKGEFERLVDGSDVDVGTIPMQRGHVVSGRIVDARGAPLPDVMLAIHGIDTHLPAGRQAMSMVGAASDEQGRFTFSPLLPAGRWQVRPFGRGELRGGGRFAFEDADGPPLLELVLELRTTIAGSVVHVDGRPARGVRVSTVDGVASTWSHGRGFFRLEAPTHRVGATTIVLDAERFPDVEPQAVEWGDEQVVVRLPATPALEVSAVDDAGNPVAPCTFVLGLAGDLRPQTERCEQSPAAASFVPERGGPQLLRAVPESEELGASEAREVVLTGEPLAPQRLVVPRLQPADVLVVDAAGAAIAGAAVELRHCDPDVPASWFANDWRNRPTTALGGRSERVSGGSTDAGGRLSLRAPRSPDGLHLRVAADGYLAEVVDASPLAASRTQRVVLRRGARVRGVVQCAGTERDRIMVNVLAVGEHEPFDTCMLDSASAFVSERLRAGRYVVRAVRAMTCAGEGYSVTRLVAARVGDGVADRAVEREVLLADGADVEVELTVPQAAFGTLHGRLAVAGVTTPFDSVCLVTEEGGGVCGEFALQRDGSFVAADVLVGRYRLELSARFAPVQLPPVVTIAAGQVTSHEFRYTWRRVTVEVVDARGKPYDGRLELRCGGRDFDVAADRGELVLEPAPELPFVLRRGPERAWSPPASPAAERPRVVVP